MTYTKGIRKIFDTNHLEVGVTLYGAAVTAMDAGYMAMTFNGIIYILDKDANPIKTPFDIQDFEA